MNAAQAMLGDMDAAGWLFIGLIALCSVAGFVLAVVLICVKVFGRRAADIVTIKPRREEEDGR